jgi:hypothetical protein
MTMPAGVYYVGDLCYVMTDDEWDQFCAITIKDNECLEGEFTMPDGRRFATYGTAYGDGEYKDQYGNQYGVDAGLIGCIKLTDIKLNVSDVHYLGAVHTFANDFETTGGRNDTHWDGIIHIGHVRIETDPQVEDEDYYVN